MIEGKWFEVDEAKQHTFDDLMEKFMREHAPGKESKTQESYKNSLVHLNPFFSGMTLADITPKNISDYYENRKGEGASIATINREFAMLSKAFNLAYKRWEWVKENPCNKAQKEPENNQVDRWLIEDEYQRLIKASTGYLDGQLTDIILMALHTGMRQGEILSLKWNDVDLFRKVITVLKTKNKKPKSIPMTDTIHDLLVRKSKVVIMSGYIFTTDSNRIKKRTLIREFDKVMVKAGINDFTFHCLRHTAATWMIQSGIDIYTVSKILGHRDIKTTMKYAHHYPESLRHGVRAIDNFMKNQGKNEVVKEAVLG
ncbi:MAG: site-specific integrase [Nitrospinae bacterium]|nr:site-specific integrase [Nitrospinota bacterium]